MPSLALPDVGLAWKTRDFEKMVRSRGLEPPHRFGYMHLKLGRLSSQRIWWRLNLIQRRLNQG
jgi:hypothetical protein